MALFRRSLPKNPCVAKLKFDDTTFEEKIQISTIQNALDASNFSQSFNEDEEMRTSTPFMIHRRQLPSTPNVFNQQRKRARPQHTGLIIRNPMNRSILMNSQKRRINAMKLNDSKKKVLFGSPTVVKISLIDEKLKKSFKNEKGAKRTPMRSRIPRPRLLNFQNERLAEARSSSDEEAKELPIAKRRSLGTPMKASKPKDTRRSCDPNMLNGVKLNRRFELMMKNLTKKL